MTYAIIKVAGKQYRVREGERLLVDRLHQDDGATFAPTVLLVGGDGAPQLDPGDGVVTAKVLGDDEGAEDPDRQVQEAHRLSPAHRFPRVADADPDRVDRRQAGAGEPPRRRPRQAGADEEPRRAEAAAAPAGDLPAGYADMTIADIKGAAGDWDAAAIAAALAYEQEHGKRKGALAALEAAQANLGGES